MDDPRMTAGRGLRTLGGVRAETVLFNLLLVPFLFWGLHASDTDTFYHLASGRWMFENGRVLDRETFSFLAPGRPWLNFYWLFQCLLYGSWRVGGYPGVLVLRALVVVLTANLLYASIRRRTGDARVETFVFALLAFSLYLPRALNMRGHVFSYLFLVVLVSRLDLFLRGARRFDPVLPALCVVWANVHGAAYPVALSVIGVYAAAALFPYRHRRVGEALRDSAVNRWLWVGAACVLAFAVTPFGTWIYWTLRNVFTSGTLVLPGQEEALSQIGEMSRYSWAAFRELAPDLDIWSLAIFNWTFLVGLALCPRWIRRRDVLALGSFALGAALALYMLRFVTEFMILAVPFIAGAVADARREGGPRRRHVRPVLVVVGAYLVLAIGLKVERTWAAGGEAFEIVDGRIHPVGPVRLMEKEGLRGNLFCNPTAAGYVTWVLHPSRVRVFMDMRTPILFTAQEVWLYKAIGDTVGLDALRRRFPVDYLLLDRGSPLAEAVRTDRQLGYLPVWADQRFLLFAHEEALSGRPGLPLRSLDAMLRLEADLSLLTDEEAERVEAEATRLAETWPGNHLAQSSVIRAQLRRGRLNEALTRARDLAARYPTAAAYPYLEALALAGLGRSAEATRALQDARRREPDFLPVYPALAGLLAPDPNAALRVMEEYSRRRRFRLSAPEHMMLGALRYRRREFAAAADAYERALWQLGEDDPVREEAVRGLAAAKAAAAGRE
jgi:hypothetical protein